MKLSCVLLSVFWPNMIHANPIIKNNNIPACRNCKFFMPKYYNQFDSDMNRCVKFGEKDIITGKIEYDFVSTSRKDEAKCGSEGKEFEEEDNLGLKEFRHILQHNYPAIFVGSIFVFYFWSLIVFKK